MARACRRYPRALLVVQTAYYWQPLGKTWQICGVWTKYALSLEGLTLATWENAGEKPERVAGCCPYRSYLPCLSFRVANLSDLDYLRRGSVENGCAFCPEWPALRPKRPCSSARTTRPAPDGGPCARATRAPAANGRPCTRTAAPQLQMASPAPGRLRPGERPVLRQSARASAANVRSCVRRMVPRSNGSPKCRLSNRVCHTLRLDGFRFADAGSATRLVRALPHGGAAKGRCCLYNRPILKTFCESREDVLWQ